MTNHAGFAAADAVAAVAPPAQAGRHFSSFPPPRTTTCRKSAARMELAAVDGTAAVEAGSLLETMRSSSPRHAKPVAAGAEHVEWMENHPSALARFDSFLAEANGKHIVVFLDYDGTLSNIVDDPDHAVMTDDMREAVRAVAKLFPTAIVSGRGRDKVAEFVKLDELYYAGSHGMDIKGPTAQANRIEAKAGAVLCQKAIEFLPVIEEVFQELTTKMAAIPGAIVENNKFCMSVHFRCVDEQEWESLGNQVRAVLEGYPGQLRLTKGRKVLEIRPCIEWNKGNALEFLLQSLGYKGSKDVFPIYIGDDRTDEDAFKVLREMGQGMGILVTKFPKETSASYSLRDPAECFYTLEASKLAKRILKQTPMVVTGVVYLGQGVSSQAGEISEQWDKGLINQQLARYSSNQTWRESSSIIKRLFFNHLVLDFVSSLLPFDLFVLVVEQDVMRSSELGLGLEGLYYILLTRSCN